MNKEDKELLLRDLCARLPYGVKAHIVSREADRNVYVTEDNICHVANGWWKECKPYLFPLSSMTEEQKRKYDSIIYRSVELHHEEYYDVIDIDAFEELQEFYHENHIDYREFIDKGLAIDATGLNIY